MATFKVLCVKETAQVFWLEMANVRKQGQLLYKILKTNHSTQLPSLLHLLHTYIKLQPYKLHYQTTSLYSTHIVTLNTYNIVVQE